MAWARQVPAWFGDSHQAGRARPCLWFLLPWATRPALGNRSSLGHCRVGWSPINTWRPLVKQSACRMGVKGGTLGHARPVAEWNRDVVSQPRVLFWVCLQAGFSEVRGRPGSLRMQQAGSLWCYLAGPPKACGDTHVPTHVLLMPSK